MVRRRSTVRFRNGAPQELTCEARSEAHWTALILRGGWELFPCWEESGRSPSAGPALAGLAGAGRGVSDLVIGDPAAGLCEDASARVYEHPALLRLLDLSLGLVFSAICPPAATSKCPEMGNPIVECDCVRSCATPDPLIRRQVAVGRRAVRAALGRPFCCAGLPTLTAGPMYRPVAGPA
jgi:hypothetical protein